MCASWVSSALPFSECAVMQPQELLLCKRICLRMERIGAAMMMKACIRTFAGAGRGCWECGRLLSSPGVPYIPQDSTTVLYNRSDALHAVCPLRLHAQQSASINTPWSLLHGQYAAGGLHKAPELQWFCPDWHHL